MSPTRQAAVAGMFYPDNPVTLRKMVDNYIREADAEDIIPRAVIAPHAGYVYSGSIAGTAYAFLENAKETVKRVVLIGPSHRVPFSGIAASSAEYFATPLGNVSVDVDAVKKAMTLSQVQLVDEAHAQEHSLEVQLPFLQRVFDDFSLVPLLVGNASAEQVSEVIELLMDEETVTVISSDLTHYLEYEKAKTIDEKTAKSIERLEYEAIDSHAACGLNPLKGLLFYARNSGLKARTVHLANSGDTAGSRESVVGYGAWVFWE